MTGTSILAYIILSLSIGYVFAYSTFNEISSLFDKKQKMEESLEMMADVENKKNQLLTEFNKITPEERIEIDTVLPNSLDFTKLIYQIDAVAASKGIKIDKISLQEMSGSSGDSIATAEQTKPYQSATVGFSFSTSYENFKTFMDVLEKSRRVLDIRSVKITPDKLNNISYDVQFETYWLKP